MAFKEPIYNKIVNNNNWYIGYLSIEDIRLSISAGRQQVYFLSISYVSYVIQIVCVHRIETGMR